MLLDGVERVRILPLHVIVAPQQPASSGKEFPKGILGKSGNFSLCSFKLQICAVLSRRQAVPSSQQFV